MISYRSFCVRVFHNPFVSAVDRSLAQYCDRAWDWHELECLSPVFDLTLGTWPEIFAPD